MSETFPSLGRKKTPEVEVEVYRPKRAAEGWEVVWKKNGEPEPIAGQGWRKSLHTADCWGWSKAKGDVYAQGFISAWKARIPRPSKLNFFHLNF